MLRARAIPLTGGAFLLFLVACGGGGTNANASPPATAATPPPGSGAGSGGAEASPPSSPNGASVVRFDDLAMTYSIPAGWHVIGDDELAKSIQTYDSSRLSREFKRRVAAHGAFPLLSLSHGEAEGDRVLATVTIVRVGKDDDPVTLLSGQRDKLSHELEAFTPEVPPAAITRDGVTGAEMRNRYALRRADGAKLRAAGWLRLYVRGELGVLQSVVWVERPGGAPPLEGTEMMDALHFAPPA